MRWVRRRSPPRLPFHPPATPVIVSRGLTPTLPHCTLTLTPSSLRSLMAPAASDVVVEEVDDGLDTEAEAFLAKQQEAMQRALATLEAEQDKTTSVRALRRLFDLSLRMAEDVLQGFACYVATYDAAADELQYEFTSATCSPQVRGKTLRRTEAADCPSFAQCLGPDPGASLVSGVHSLPAVAWLGPQPEEDGDLFVAPIVGVRGAVLGH